MKLPDRLILFDGHCHLCDRSVKTIIKYDSKKLFYFASLQSELGKKIIRDFAIQTNGKDSIIYLKNGKPRMQSEAVLWLSSELDFPINLFGGLILFPPFIRNSVYEFVSSNRYSWFGKSESCLLPNPSQKERFIDL